VVLFCSGLLGGLGVLGGSIVVVFLGVLAARYEFSAA
jgi:hypothetical protein